MNELRCTTITVTSWLMTRWRHGGRCAVLITAHTTLQSWRHNRQQASVPLVADESRKQTQPFVHNANSIRHEWRYKNGQQMMAMVMKMMMTMVVAPPTIQRLPYPSVPACDKLQHRATGGHDADLSIKLNGHCSCAAHYFVRIPHTSSDSRS